MVVLSTGDTRHWDAAVNQVLRCFVLKAPVNHHCTRSGTLKTTRTPLHATTTPDEAKSASSVPPRTRRRPEGQPDLGALAAAIIRRADVEMTVRPVLQRMPPSACDGRRCPPPPSKSPQPPHLTSPHLASPRRLIFRLSGDVAILTDDAVYVTLRSALLAVLTKITAKLHVCLSVFVSLSTCILHSSYSALLLSQGRGQGGLRG